MVKITLIIKLSSEFWRLKMKSTKNKKPHRRYDSEANDKLNNYVQLKYQDQLSNGALLLYSFGIPRLEQRKSGFCKQFTANYVEIGKASYKSCSKLRKPLITLFRQSMMLPIL